VIKLKPPQLQVFLSPQRFRLLVAGRRFGKTFLAGRVAAGCPGQRAHRLVHCADLQAGEADRLGPAEATHETLLGEQTQ
jgi:hypothetical protein